MTLIDEVRASAYTIPTDRPSQRAPWRGTRPPSSWPRSVPEMSGASTERQRRARSWSGHAGVERETASWVRWYNATRIHHSIGRMSPIEFEEQYRLTTRPPPDEVA